METYFTVFNKGKTYLLILKLFLGVYNRMSYIFLNIFSYVLCNMLFFLSCNDRKFEFLNACVCELGSP